MSVLVVTDSACDLPARLRQELDELGVKIIPILFRFGLEECEDKTLSMADFLERAKKIWPATSAPSIGTFAETFRAGVEAAREVVCINVTSRHSATYASAAMASQSFAPGQVTVVDSRSLSVGQGLLVLAAARAAAAGKRAGEIAEMLSGLAQRLHTYIALDTVENLVRGGRASKLMGVLATALKIRPVLDVVEGELTAVAKPRGREAAKLKLLELVQGTGRPEAIGVSHVMAEEDAHDLAARIAALIGFPRDEILVCETGMVLGTHGGPGVLAVTVLSA